MKVKKKSETITGDQHRRQMLPFWCAYNLNYSHLVTFREVWSFESEMTKMFNQTHPESSFFLTTLARIVVTLLLIKLLLLCVAAHITLTSLLPAYRVIAGSVQVTYIIPPLWLSKVIIRLSVFSDLQKWNELPSTIRAGASPVLNRAFFSANFHLPTITHLFLPPLILPPLLYLLN